MANGRGLSHQLYISLGKIAVQVIQRIINVDYKIPIRPKVSEAAKDLLRRIFIADPHKRLTVKEIKVGSICDLPEGVDLAHLYQLS